MYLEKELESLKVVLEIKNNQLHQKEKKLMEMDKLVGIDPPFCTHSRLPAHSHFAASTHAHTVTRQPTNGLTEHLLLFDH